MKKFFVILGEDGSISEQIISKDHPLVPPELGIAPMFDVPADRIIEVSRFGNLQFENLVDGEWVSERDRRYASLEREIDDERSRQVRQLEHRSPQIAVSYQRKAAEASVARRDSVYLKANNPSGKYPWIEAEAAERGVTLREAMDSILKAAAAADAPVAAIHAKAVGLKKRLREAETIDDMIAVYEDTKKGA